MTIDWFWQCTINLNHSITLINDWLFGLFKVGISVAWLFTNARVKFLEILLIHTYTDIVYDFTGGFLNRKNLLQTQH